MNKFYKVTLTALTTAVISVSALAAPHDNHGKGHPHAYKHPAAHGPQHRPGPPVKLTAHGYRPAPPGHAYGVRWKGYQKLPAKYQSARYRVSSYQRHGLPRPAHNQQWYKVDNQYILANLANNTILRVLGS